MVFVTLLGTHLCLHSGSCGGGLLCWLTSFLTFSPPGRPLWWKDVRLQRCGIHCWWRRRPRHPPWNWQSPGENAAGRTVYFISSTTVSSLPAPRTCTSIQDLGVFSEVNAAVETFHWVRAQLVTKHISGLPHHMEQWARVLGWRGLRTTDRPILPFALSCLPIFPESGSYGPFHMWFSYPSFLFSKWGRSRKMWAWGTEDPFGWFTTTWIYATCSYTEASKKYVFFLDLKAVEMTHLPEFFPS